MTQSIEASIFRRERAAKSADFARDARNNIFANMQLPQEVHEWCRELIRNPEKRLSHRREWTFESIANALNYVEDVIDAESKCVVFGYNLDSDISFLMPVSTAFSAIRDRNTLLSVDGVIFANVNVTSFFILDYEDADSERSLSRVFCSVVGEIALDPKFPGAK